MSAFSYSRPMDRVVHETHPGKVDFSSWTGSWMNTWAQSEGILRFTLRQTADGAMMFKASTNDPANEWPEVEIHPFAAATAESAGIAFKANVDFGFMDVDLSAYTVNGLIVIAVYNRFKDGSNRNDYMIREFYFRESH
ncbi:MAG: hypothetical protein QNK37_26870 [Acidobacteriota bacterium]|nr:hypothetical protein [Acidobacteriota bacterium]